MTTTKVQDWTGTVAVYACSHRAGGNSGHAAEAIAQGVRQAGGRARVVTLREHTVLHCLACGGCARDKQSRCVLRSKDQAEELFAPLLAAPVVVIASPIYFYALPSLFKALIDRSQRFWEAKRKGDAWLAAIPQRPALACLVAGQPTGQKLFDGARLTLTYFLANLNLSLAEPLPLRGMDGPGDLAASAEALALAVELGERAWRAASDA